MWRIAGMAPTIGAASSGCRRLASEQAAKGVPTNALLRRVWKHAAASTENAATKGVPLSQFVRSAEELVIKEPEEFAPLKPWGDASLHSVASTTINRIYHAKRGVCVDESTNRVFLEPNSSVKHSRAVLRAVARLPDKGAARRTLRSWLPKLSEDEFTAAIERVFDTWVSVDGDTVVPVRPGSSPAVRSVFQIVMAAPDDGIGLRQIASSVASRTGKTMGAEELMGILAELWPYHALTTTALGPGNDGVNDEGPAPDLMARSVCFIDWFSVMRRVVDRLPCEGTTLGQFKRMLLSEGNWSPSTPPDFDGIVTGKWLDTHFGHLFHTRVSRTDGITIIITPRVAVAAPGAASDVLCALFASADGTAPTTPLDLGWRDAEAPLAALESIRPARAAVGTESWLQFAREHPAIDHKVLIEIRPRPDRTRAITFVDATAGSAEEVDGWLQKAQVFGEHAVEWKRVALRTGSQPAHGANDVVSPAWLEPEFVLAAQATNLETQLAGPSADVRELVVVCSDEAAERYARVVGEAAPAALESLRIVTPTTTIEISRQ